MTRKQAREQALILIFEKSFRDEPIPDIILAAKEARDLEDDPFIDTAANGVFSHLEQIDRLISDHISGWKIERISRVALAAMRLALYEMLYMEDIPTGVSINEAVELTKQFASKEDAAYINGVLGSVAKQLEA